MAENAAHLSTTVQKNPTIFEVVAQESLMSSLEASTKVLCEIISAKNPGKFQWLIKWYDEIYLCFNCFLQYHYMKTCNSSFSEAFYNLKRVSLYSREELTFNNKVKSIFILVFLPYLSEKLRLYLEKCHPESSTYGPEKKKLYNTLVFVNKYFNMTYESIKLIQYIRYMTGSSSTHSPLLNIAGAQLVYQPDDSKRFPDYSWKEIVMSMFTSTSRIPDLKSLLVKVFCQSLELSAFFVQFLKWWHTEDLKSKMAIQPIPKPPQSNFTENSLISKGLCPICQRKRRVEVVLQTSGYMFCYKCILQVLDSTGKCPLSGLPSTSRDLIRTYNSQV